MTDLPLIQDLKEFHLQVSHKLTEQEQEHFASLISHTSQRMVSLLDLIQERGSHVESKRR